MPSIREYLIGQGVPDQHGDEWIIECPNPDHEDSHPSASVYVGAETVRANGRPRLPGMWVCYSCGARGRFGKDGSFEPTTDEVLDSVDADLRYLEDGTRVRTYPEAWLNLFDTPHEYWQERFTKEAVEYWRLGFDYEQQKLTYPMRDYRGKVLGVVRRKLPGQTGPKYKYPRDLNVRGHLFGYSAMPDRVGTIALVEGALDVVALWEAEVPALAIYGSSVSVEQVRLLRRLAPVCVCLAFDMDEAGRRAVEQAVYSELNDLNISIASWNPDEGKDVAELPLERRAEVIKESVLWTG